MVQIEAAATAAKEAEKVKNAKKRSGTRRGGSGGRGSGNRIKSNGSSSYSRREAPCRRGQTVKSERSRERIGRESYRDVKRASSRRNYDDDIELGQSFTSPRGNLQSDWQILRI